MAMRLQSAELIEIDLQGGSECPTAGTTLPRATIAAAFLLTRQ